MTYPILNFTLKPITVKAQPITLQTFLPYGTLVESPLPNKLVAAPVNPPHLQSISAEPTLVNQGYAIKYSPISPVQNSYESRRSDRQAASPCMSLFCCFPRKLRISNLSPATFFFDVGILERHPFSSQTFIPLSAGFGRSGKECANDHLSSGTPQNISTLYLVIVAPSLGGQTAAATLKVDGHVKSVVVQEPPDMSNLCAFIVHPDQAVTYSAGTWHSPMVVLGDSKIDFVVFQFLNGVAEEDCQTVAFDEAVTVCVESRQLGQGTLAKL
ncbi:hypothetical protein LOZ61_000733 [Ophidiomyces ophidiicola]|nr:hypothetical protein LOZ61_000733 [Ophidiomyces ophidiicola]KAI1929663.1 hypothetical protein LOZ60_001410 [Ophidiomyces ophidiicola]